MFSLQSISTWLSKGLCFAFCIATLIAVEKLGVRLRHDREQATNTEFALVALLLHCDFSLEEKFGRGEVERFVKLDLKLRSRRGKRLLRCEKLERIERARILYFSTQDVISPHGFGLCTNDLALQFLGERRGFNSER